ncbi:MAG: dienelactone hydrolase family protein [Flavisolibacter sp.]|nr:dienelactone hydrolase family protein [Flavisolibacter sp.]MBD0350400.1 dienelactone hydrolase family protein [Flavisolibacter sp.]
MLSCSDNNTNNKTTNTPGKTTTIDNNAIKEEPIAYKVDTTTFNSYVYYNDQTAGKRPIVLVVPEWWGLNDYPRMRARQLAQMGYLAVAVDMYGNGKVAATPQEAQSAATPLFQNPQMAKQRLEAALAKAKEYPQADTTQTAAIGYCFGGGVVLNAARLGSDLDGVVSFHGSLAGPPPAKNMKTKILVCHGGNDNFAPPAQVEAFKKSMDSIGADYTFKVYPGAMHAFTNPDATETGKKFNMPIAYNAAADTVSWNDMKAFFSRIFH